MKHRMAMLLLVGLAGCSKEKPPVSPTPAPDANVICTMEARPAITVEPVDAATNAPVFGVTVRAVTAAFGDTAMAHVPTAHSVSLAHERPGIYTVTVMHPDYRDWRAENVQVTRDACHVQTVTLKASLVRK